MSRPVRALFALLALAAGTVRADEPAATDEAAIRQLNADFMRAFLACDVARFRTLISDDFTGVQADGRVIDKAEFLRLAKDNLDARDLRLRDVVIRQHGDAAVVGALAIYDRPGGPTLRTRYSCLCVRRDGRWSVVWTQWTRAVAP
jgi:ketosteroid isomerase-like protein